MEIILASSSKYRVELLQRTGIRFTARSPDIDESAKPGEDARALVKRLSIAKAMALAEFYKDALIIGSDQVAVLNDRIIGKPQDHEGAVRQLESASAQTMTLYAGIALVNTQSMTTQYDLDRFEVEFKKISRSQINNYLNQEKPYDCCGSLKAEGPGMALLSRLSGDDPSTLIGMPLLKLITLLENEHVFLF